ncbi:MAG: hypothetical protein IPP73_13805 [Chitinophagaceae bacterium]|nr:hypothetical protein [Chitinophagaceae bacterium]
MRISGLTISLLFCLNLLAQQPIGNWREELPYNSAIDCAAAPGLVFCATPYSLFSVSVPGNAIERYSRISGLSETGISAIRYDAASEKLFIAYSNSNVDILYRNDIYNIPDIKRSGISGDKTIYNIYPLGNKYYCATGIGVVVLDGTRYETSDSWFIGNSGGHVKVNDFTSDAGFYYAATEEGLKKTAVNTPNPSNYTQWTLVSGTNGLPAAPAKNVFRIQNKVFVTQHDTIFIQNGNSWSFLYTDNWPWVNVSESEGKIMVCARQANGVSRVVILNADGTTNRILNSSAAVSFPRKAILVNNDPWVADQFGCLSHFGAGNDFQQLIPSSPQGTASGEMLVYRDVFYASSGSVNDAWNYQYNGDGLYVYKEGDWNNINRYKYARLDSLLDFVSLAIDPRDETIWAGSYGGGLLHVKPGPVFEIFKQNTLGETTGDPGSYRVGGLVFDQENNLWVSNFGSVQPLRVRKADGTWKNFTPPFFLNQNSMAQIVVDENNYKWIVSPLGNGLICFDHGSSIDNTGDDRWKRYYTGTGTGNLPSAEVMSVAVDKDGYIWVGTTDGIGVIQCPGDIFTGGGCDATWPIVPNGNFAGYLFKGQSVRSIAVDGANRKWIATKNGVFLVSASGEKVIYQFTEDNSPLLNNDVRKIAIDGKTGEVYFATLKGICSFRSTATEGGVKNENVLVFPNPVPPGYTGTIAIRGLVENAIVKITEPDGRLIYQTRALGGQAVWDGKDYRGNKISSGVYLVLINDGNKQETAATKIVFIQR